MKKFTSGLLGILPAYSPPRTVFVWSTLHHSSPASSLKRTFVFLCRSSSWQQIASHRSLDVDVVMGREKLVGWWSLVRVSSRAIMAHCRQEIVHIRCRGSWLDFSEYMEQIGTRGFLLSPHSGSEETTSPWKDVKLVCQIRRMLSWQMRRDYDIFHVIRVANVVVSSTNSFHIHLTLYLC